MGYKMKIRRRKFLALAAGAAALPAVSRIGWAQSYPTRSVRLIIPSSPGGMTDINGRLIGEWLSQRLGQPIVYENRAGAGTVVATEATVRSPADGYTLLIIASANAIDATLNDKLSYNFGRDIAPVASLIRTPNVLVVNPSLPANTVPEFIAYAKANPDKVNAASAGVGTSQHIAAELFNMMAGLKMRHVAYRGSALAMTDVIGGQVQAIFAPMVSSIEYVKGGQLRALGITSAARSQTLQELPTIAEFLPG